MRYSNILDGIFHEKVVICEADSDNRFLAAVHDAVLDLKGSDTRRPDVMFTHCGGKSRLPMAVAALRQLGVPAAAVADFDILNNENPLKAVIAAFGGNWSDFQKDWKMVKDAVDKRKPELNTDDARKEIMAILEGISEPVFPDRAVEAIESALSRTSAWATAKQTGKSYVPSGDQSVACERLLGNLRKLGLFVVEVGEAEGFVRTVGGHGPKWVNKVLETKNLKTDPELEQARKFVEQFLS